MAECDYRDLNKFCFPEQNKDISWFDSFDELKDAKFDPDEAPHGTLWRATRKYFEKKIEECQSNILRNEQQIEEFTSALEDLDEESMSDIEDEPNE